MFSSGHDEGFFLLFVFLKGPGNYLKTLKLICDGLIHILSNVQYVEMISFSRVTLLIKRSLFMRTCCIDRNLFQYIVEDPSQRCRLQSFFKAIFDLSLIISPITVFPTKWRLRKFSGIRMVLNYKECILLIKNALGA